MVLVEDAHGLGGCAGDFGAGSRIGSGDSSGGGFEAGGNALIVSDLAVGIEIKW